MKRTFSNLLALAAMSVVVPSSPVLAQEEAKPVATASATQPTTRPATRPVMKNAPRDAAELFQTDKVWTVHLTFTPAQWERLQPRRVGGGFSAGLFVAPMLLNLADKDNDGQLSRQEFRGLADGWYGEWDSKGTNSLDSEQLVQGLNVTFDAKNPAGKAMAEAFSADSFLLGAEGQRNGLASSMGVEFEYAAATLEFEDLTLANVGVRYKGNGTWVMAQGSDKRSLKIDVNQFLPGMRMLGMTQVNLHNCVTDPSFMAEVLSHRLYRDAGVPAPRTSYARVYVAAPGKHDSTYLGLYSIVEDISKPFAKAHFKDDKGAFFKPVTSKLFSYRGEDWARYQQMYDPKDASAAETKRVIEFAKLVTNGSDEAFAAKVKEFVDLPAFAKYMAVTASLSTLDSILGTGQNFSMYLHPKTKQFHFIPWDLDHSFGRADFMAGASQREHLSIDRPWVGENRFLERVFKTPGFREMYRKEIESLVANQFKPERIRQQVDELAKVIRPAVREEGSGKATRFDEATKESASRGGFSLKSLAAAALPSGPKTIKSFVGVRHRSLVEQLAGKSRGEVIDRGLGGRDGAVAEKPPETSDGKAPAPKLGTGVFIGPPLMLAADANKDHRLTREEFLGQIDTWFDRWKSPEQAGLTRDLLRAGLDRDLAPQPPPTTRPTTRPATRPLAGGPTASK